MLSGKFNRVHRIFRSEDQNDLSHFICDFCVVASVDFHSFFLIFFLGIQTTRSLKHKAAM